MLLAAAFVLAAGGSALAENAVVEVPLPKVEADFNAGFKPMRLSKSKRTPLSPWVSMRFRDLDGPRPPALKEFKIEGDRHLRLNLEGVPSCSRGTVEGPPMRQRCKDSESGSGTMVTSVVLPEVTIPPAHSKLTVYNGSLRNGVRTLFLDANVTAPTPAEIVITVEVKHSGLGRYGLKLVGSVPKIAGGDGSITFLAWRFHQSVFSATCPADRQLDTRFNTTLADGTQLDGGVIRACTPAA